MKNDRPVILCPCPAPKRLLTSANWISRNDSSNIDAILHPENCIFSPRLKYDEKAKGDVTVTHILGGNNCYCRCKSKKLPKPSFFQRPNSCVTYGLMDNDDLKRKSLVGCVCSKEVLNTGKPKLNLTKSVPVEVGLKQSEQRMTYEEYRQKQEEKLREQLQDFEDNEEYDKLEVEGGSNVDTILGTQKFQTSTSVLDDERQVQKRTMSTDELPTDEYPIYEEWSVPNFRKEHYFETHNIGKIGDIADNKLLDHTCIHQFKLDKRWLPEPLNTDPFGRSLCKICEKPMGGSTINLSSGRLFSGDDVSRSKIKNFAEAYKNGLTPTTINLGSGKSKIELVLKESDVSRFSGFISKVKKPIYINSLALRHQKMRSH